VQEQAAGLTEQQSENKKLLDRVKEAEVSLLFGPTRPKAWAFSVCFFTSSSSRHLDKHRGRINS
jgi:hypothetical protein